MITYDSRYFDIGDTLRCGQVFRFSPEGNGFRVYSGDKTAYVETKGDRTYVVTDDESYFHRYFDLDTDYAAVRRRCGRFPEAARALERGRGIRILRQQPFETVVASILSANNNIPRIRGIMRRLCEKYGKDCGGYRGFPCPEALQAATADDYRTLGAGYRAPYLAGTVQAVLNGALEEIGSLDTESAGRVLMRLPGVGRKVADCILLFGLGRGDVCPVDTWIFKAFRSPTLDTPDKVRAYCIERYGSDAGYVQQMIFYDTRG